jgi:threonine/homoserine/homoserine lactone efflux protein
MDFSLFPGFFRMDSELFLALCLFAAASSITPGPNNMMLLASGVNFGIRPTIPHMLGITIGFVVMLIVVGSGLGVVLLALPVLHGVLRILCAIYMIYLAYSLATSGGLGGEKGRGKPMTFLQAALFQWVNPKAWAMGLTAMTVYTVPDPFWISIFVVAVVFGVINLPCIGIWAGFGVALRGFLSNSLRLRLFNIGMAVLLLASTLPLLWAEK